jgi:uncharacterized membrane protein YqjE
MTTMGQSNRSIADIVSDAAFQLTSLFRTEVRLARAEVSESVSRASMGLGFIGIAAVLLIPALVILLEAAVAALIQSGYTAAMSSLIVGAVTLVIGAILLAIGVQRLRAANLVPEKTIHQLQRDVATAKQQARQDNDLQRAA